MEARCKCGKKFTFPNMTEANNFLLTNRALKLGLIRSYQCELRKGVWHLTSHALHSTSFKKGNPRTQSNFSLLELELHREMATLKEWIVEYLAKAYKEKNIVEFAPAEVKAAYAKAFPGKNAQSVYATIGFLKKDGIIVDLNKHIPGTSRGTFFTLAKILEKETNPVSKKSVPVNVPAQPTNKEEPKKTSPLTVAANPFDKVNTTLAEILAKVNGLVQGYSELVQKTPNVDVTVDFSEVKEMLSKHDEAVVDRFSTLKNFIDNKVLDLVKEKSTTPSVHSVEVGGAAVIAEAVNNRLTDLVDENSLIYRIREEVSSITDTESKWIVENISVPEGVSNQDDYRAGLKEGIRLATELSLTIREE